MTDILDALVMFGAVLALGYVCVYCVVTAWATTKYGPLFVDGPGPSLLAAFAALYLVFATLWVVAWGLV